MSDGTNGGSTEGASTTHAARSVTTSSGTVSFGSGAVAEGSPAPAATPAARPPATPAERRRARREAYWDRPKPPKDWRYWVGGFGRALIVLGLLMFAFVAYQLWGTGIEEARAQDQLTNELEQRQTELGTVPVLIPAATSAPTAATPTTPPVTAVPGVTTAPPETLAPAPPVLSLPPIAEGDVLGRLSIPSIGVDKNIIAGVTVADLKQGPGHFPQTPMPGELGNAAIAGHRTTFGGPFLDVDELQPGDEIIFTNLYSQQFVYTVTGTEVVEPSDGHVINTTDPSLATVTLITCTPVRTSEQRLVIHAELDLTRSPAPTAAQRYYGQEGDEIAELPGDDTSAAPTLPAEPTATAEPVEPSVTTPDPAVTADSAATTSAASDPSSTAGAASTIALAAGAEPPSGFSDADPFAAGWFSDTAAWPQVIAWGLALAALCVGCYLLARALRRRWVGWAVAAVPFVVLLYFFFQNVNRLLPPGL